MMSAFRSAVSFPETNAKHPNSGQLYHIHLFLANPSSSMLAFVCLSSPTDIHIILTLFTLTKPIMHSKPIVAYSSHHYI